MAQLSEAPAPKNLRVDNCRSEVTGIDFGSGIPTLKPLEICSECIQNVNFGENMTALRELIVSGGNKAMGDICYVIVEWLNDFRHFSDKSVSFCQFMRIIHYS